MIKKINQAASILGLVLCAVLAYVFWKAGLFDSKEALTSCISRFGWAGPAVFITFQAVQVVIPHPARRAGVSGRGHPVRRVERLLVQLYRHLRRVAGGVCHRPRLRPPAAGKRFPRQDD